MISVSVSFITNQEKWFTAIHFFAFKALKYIDIIHIQKVRRGQQPNSQIAKKQKGLGEGTIWVKIMGGGKVGAFGGNEADGQEVGPPGEGRAGMAETVAVASEDGLLGVEFYPENPWSEFCFSSHSLTPPSCSSHISRPTL